MQLKSIRTKSLVVLIPLFLINFLILAGISYYLANQNLQESSREIASQMGEKFSWQIKYEVDRKMHVLGELAGNPVFRGDDAAAKIRTLAEAKARNQFPSMMVLDAQGNGFSTDGKPLKRGDREYVKRVMETRQPYVPRPILSAITKTLTVVLTTPVYDNGQMVGMITGTIDLGELSNLLGAVKFRESSYGYLVERSGLVLAHPKNPEMINQMNVLSDAASSGSQPAAALDERLRAAFREVLASDGQVTVRYANLDGTEHEAVITPIDLADQRWAMIVTTPVAEIEADAVHLANIMGGVSLVFILAAIAAIFLFSQRIARGISSVRDECMALNEGDLRDRRFGVGGRDEIGQLADGFRKMRQTLNALICQIQDKSDNVAAAGEELNASVAQSVQASGRVAASIAEIARGANDQSHAAGEVGAVAQNIFNNAERISVKAQEIVRVTDTATESAGAGRESIARAVEQMKRIGEGSAEVEEAVGELARGSKEIGNIVDIISNIAGQTNLLALNAAIEAARAGEAGRGFAVVADEVRKLAEESNQSSQKIGQLVKKNQSDMEKAVSASRVGSSGAVSGIEAVTAADETFKQIACAIEGLSAEIYAISGAIKEMTEGSRNMAASIASIEEIGRKNSGEAEAVSAATQQQSSSMHEISAASENLLRLADELQRTVEKFRVSG